MRRPAISLSLLLGLVLVACGPSELGSPSPTVSAAPSASSASPSPSATASPGPSPTATASATPVPLTELGGVLRSLGTGWRPSGEWLVVQQPAGIDGNVLVAVPAGPTRTAPVELVAFGQTTGWDVRADGTAIAIALPTSADLTTSRIATWDPRTGTARWVTPEQRGVLQRTPIWSADGRAIYYTALRPPDDLGIFRVGSDGSGVTRIRAPEQSGGDLQGITPDGRGLVWTRIQAGGSTEVLDLVTGRNRSFEPQGATSALSWRSKQPRALVLTGWCCTGGPRGTIVVWDDVEGSKRAIYGSDLTSQEAVSTADWDPDGERLVAVVYDRTVSADRPGPLVTMDEHGGARRVVPGTEGANDVRWLRQGIVYMRGTTSAGAELILVPPSGGASTSLFRGEYIGVWKVVAP